MIPVFTPEVSTFDIFHVLKNLRRNNISGTSPVVEEFEDKFSNLYNGKNATAVSNGSVALEVALNLFDFSEGDEVILPSFTIISCLSAVIRSGATPIFCDVDINTWNMTVEDVEKVYSENTKAVLVVHTYGLPADILNIKEFCDKNKLLLIEDAAEAHGLNVNNKLCGTFGDASTFSFYANKHITTGEGGMVLTSSEDLSDKAKKIRNLDFNSRKRFTHENLFWNYRMGGMQASLGISQLKKLDSTIKFKKNQGNSYSELFNNYQNLFQIPQKSYLNSCNHYWVYGILLKKEGIRDKVIENLFKEGIETRPFFHPLHIQPALPKKFRKNKNLPNSEFLGKNGLYLPMGKHVTTKLQKKIVNKTLKSIKKFI